MIRVFVYGLLWILLMGVAIFATQNTLLVAIKFLAFESIELPLGLVLVFSAGLGAIATTAWQKIGQTAEAEQIPTQPASSYKSSSSYSSASSSGVSSKSTSQSTSSKNTSKNSQFDDFDEEWDDDWG